jgi:hypothetical protein
MVTPANATDSTNSAEKVTSKAPTSSGKCASGKCGTEKIYSQATITHDPQDNLVRARDGKCGLTGKGVKNAAYPQQPGDEKCVNGVCGT